MMQNVVNISHLGCLGTLDLVTQRRKVGSFVSNMGESEVDHCRGNAP
jgi:hypothetical protein